MSNALLSFFADVEPSEFPFDPSSPWVQIPLALFGAYVFFSLCMGKFGFKIFKSGEEPKYFWRKPVPWGLDVAFALFVIYTIVMPGVVGVGVLATHDRYFPKFEKTALQTEENEDFALIVQKEGEESTEEPSEEKQEEAESAAATNEDVDEETNTEVENQEPTATPKKATDNLSTQHPVARLFIRSKDKPYFGVVFFVFFLAVVVVAPLTEELIFRVIVQGAFDRIAFGRAFNKTMKNEEDSPTIVVGLGSKLLAILPPATLFAVMHFSTPEDPNAPIEVATLFRSTVIGIFANLLTIVVCVCFLQKVTRATRQDLGFGAYQETTSERVVRLLKEFARGATLFMYSMPIVYLVKIVLQTALPSYIVDPAPIFVFALWEGVVYYKTRSYPTVVGMHVGLNLTSLLFLCMTVSLP